MMFADNWHTESRTPPPYRSVPNRQYAVHGVNCARPYTGSMGSLKVNAACLETLAELCRSWSEEAGSTITPVTPGISVQASSAAVVAVHANAARTAAMLGARMQENAAHLSAAGAAFADNEQAGVAGFDALGGAAV